MNQNMRFFERSAFALQRRIQLEKMRLGSFIPHEFAICGSYSTGNVGDKAIGKAIKQQLKIRDSSSKLYSHRLDNPRGIYRILGGGGVLHDYQPEILKRRLKYVEEGGIALGVGALTISDPKHQKNVSQALDSAALVTVRDDYSKEILQPLTNTEIKVTACPAFTLNTTEQNEEYVTGVNFRPWFDQSSSFLETYYGYNINPADAQREYITTAKRIIEKVDDPVFIPFDHEDYWFAKDHFDIPIYNYRPSVKKTLKRVGSVRKMVCTRYHSLVFSALFGKPTFAVEYAPKVSELVEKLQIPSTKPTNVSVVSFSKPSKVGTLKSKSEDNFDLISESTYWER